MNGKAPSVASGLPGRAADRICRGGGAEHLQFLKEYNLTDSPLRIDTLIVKKEKGVKLRKKIGRIFRRYNIIEYKGPKDSHTVNSFFKVNSYAGLLQSSTRREREIPPEEITITLVGNHYPGKLIAFTRIRCTARRWI